MEYERNPESNEEFSETSFLRLLHVARSGDDAARNQLVQQYRDYLLFLANNDMDQTLRTKLGASDVVQQSMMAIHQNLTQFRGNSLAEFKGWIRTILRNDMSNANRHFSRTKQRQIDREVRIQDSQEFHPDILDRNMTPQSEALLNELAVEMERCIEQLPVARQRVIRLRNFQEKSFVEIGLELDCSADAARKLWFRAFTQLKDIVITSRPEFASHMIQMSDELSSDKKS